VSTDWRGKIKFEGNGAVSFSYSSDDGWKMSADFEKLIATAGFQIGNEKDGPVHFGVKFGEWVKLMFDPVKWYQFNKAALTDLAGYDGVRLHAFEYSYDLVKGTGGIRIYPTDRRLNEVVGPRPVEETRLAEYVQARLAQQPVADVPKSHSLALARHFANRSSSPSPLPINSDLAAEANRRGTLDVVVAGSGYSAAEATQATRPLRRIATPGNLPERIVVTVEKDGWSTEGVGKYLNTPPTRANGPEVRVVAPRTNPMADPKVKQTLDDAAKKPNVTVVIEAGRRSTPGVPPPPKSAVDDSAARVAAYVASQHAVVYPKAERHISSIGSADTALPALLKPSELATKPFTQPVAIAPVLPPSLPPSVPIVVQRDSRFRNFDPGSPGYEPLKNKTLELAKHNPVIVLDTARPQPAAAHKPEMTYLPRGGIEPVKLTNSRPADVLTVPAASSSGHRLPPSLRQSEQLQKPTDNIGGISLITPAEVPLDSGSVRAASFDGRRIVVRTTDRIWQFPDMSPDLVRAAYDCIYRRESTPELSIGAQPESAFEPGKPGQWSVFYLGGTAGTHLGLNLLRADNLLGDLAFGGSDVPRRLGADRLGIHTLAELYPDRVADNPRAGRYGGLRVYITPGIISMTKTDSGELKFERIAFDVRFDPTGPAQDEFSDTLAARWTELLKLPECGAFRELDEAARVCGVLNWLKSTGVPFDASLLPATPLTVYTPRFVPIRQSPSLESLKPVLPLSVYGPHGISRIYDCAGRMTHVLYRDGRVHEVRRKDGVILKVHSDGRGALAAVAIGNDAAAFIPATDTPGGFVFANKVKLLLTNGTYEGFAETSRTEYLHDIDPESLLTTLVRNFIAEGDAP
jgi:hypothetical protein